MQSFTFRNVTYSYPEQEEKALDNINFTVNQGEFIVICGPSGCGKSTLLRHMKPALAPAGKLSGEILLGEKPISEADEKTLSSEIGFVMQNPENGIITDKVWHELAFTSESLGIPQREIRKRVGETAAYFGIEGWFGKSTKELSGGQKQILCLASVLTTDPSVIILDEPCSQLDVVSASEFMSVLYRVNREKGITVIMSEHNTERVMSYTDRIFLMEKGRIVFTGTPEKAGERLKISDSPTLLSFPPQVRIWAAHKTDKPCPVTPAEGRKFLEGLEISPLEEKEKKTLTDEVLVCKDICFSYGEQSVLRGFSLSLKKGEIYALTGGNGSGKTTALKIISGIIKDFRGDISITGKAAYLPQNPKDLFIGNTVREELEEVSRENTEEIISLCSLENLLDRHPYDLSGGEQQRLALGKILLLKPDILLLDEPTKGADGLNKIKTGNILLSLAEKGTSVLLVSHDTAFCAEYASYCGMLFDGSIISEGSPGEFFSGNNFYTTPARILAGSLIPGAVTVGEIIESTGGRKEEFAPEPEESRKTVRAEKTPPPLSPGRKITAALSGTLSMIIFAVLLVNSDISTALSPGKKEIFLCLGLSLSLLIFILSGDRRKTSEKRLKPPPLKKRTLLSAAFTVFLIPLTLVLASVYAEKQYYNIISMAVLAEAVLPFLIIFEGRKKTAAEISVTAAICAIGIAGRAVFFMLPQFKPVMALTIVTGCVLGAETGFITGALTMLCSNMLFGQGPWTPWQMFAMGLTGFLAGLIFRKGFGKISLSAFGAFCGVFVYGLIMNFSSLITISPESISLPAFLTAELAGLPMDIIHALATFIFIFAAGDITAEKLTRIRKKYGI